MGWGSISIRAWTGAIAAAVFAACVVAPAVSRAADWIKDPQTGCATTNPFPNPSESIRWSGACADGKLEGRGTLVWYRNGVETERNDGTFRLGEMDGYAVTRYPDGNVVHGQYKQGQRHGSFMTIRAGGEYVSASYADGRLAAQRRLTPAQAQQWESRGGAQQIAQTAQPAAQAEIVASAAPPPAASEPVTGRTAVASPSRVLPPPPKPAEAAGRPLASASAAKPRSNFTLGTQVAEAIGSGDSTPPQPIASQPAAPQPAAPKPIAPKPAAPQAIAPAAASPQRAAAAATLPTLPQFSLGSQVQDAIAGPSTLAATAPSPPTIAANLPALPAAQQAPQLVPQLVPQTAPQLAPQMVPQTAPRMVPQLAPQMVPQTAVSRAPQPAPPQAVETLGPPRGTPTAITQRRPPWMNPGSGEAIALGPALPGNTPPPFPPTPMASAAPLPVGGGYYAQAPAALPQAPQPYAPAAEISPAEASRLYLAQRAAGALPGQQQTAALPSYRALAPASPYAPGQQQAQPLPATLPAAPAQTVASLPPVAMPGGGLYAAAGPEALFKQGYQLEMSGRFREAEQTYEQIMMNHSNTQTAMLANERLNGLRRFTRETGVRIAGQPGAERQSQVVAVNEPRLLPGHAPQDPAYNLPPPLSAGGTGAGATAGEAGGGMAQNLTNMTVCTQKGLYDKEARWCGIVRADDGRRLAVEVRDVVLPRFGSWSIDASTCTGGTSINWFSKGSMVRVPRQCMELKG